MRALHRLQWCPGSKQRMHFPFALSKAEGESCVGAWGLLLLLPLPPPFLDLWLHLYPRDRHEQLHSKIGPGPRFCPSMREGVRTLSYYTLNLRSDDALTV